MKKKSIVIVVTLVAVLALALTPMAIAKSGGDKMKEQGEKMKAQGKEMESQLEKGSLDINTATMEDLQKLPGVSEETASGIMEYIKENGNITSVDQLLNVSGIDEKALMMIKPFLKF